MKDGEKETPSHCGWEYITNVDVMENGIPLEQ